MKYNEIKLEPHLEEFLRSKGILSKFKHYILAFYSEFEMKDLNHFSIQSAFTWAKTHEGHMFWSDLEVEFNNYVNSLEA